MIYKRWTWMVQQLSSKIRRQHHPLTWKFSWISVILKRHCPRSDQTKSPTTMPPIKAWLNLRLQIRNGQLRRKITSSSPTKTLVNINWSLFRKTREGHHLSCSRILTLFHSETKILEQCAAENMAEAEPLLQTKGVPSIKEAKRSCCSKGKHLSTELVVG